MNLFIPLKRRIHPEKAFRRTGTSGIFLLAIKNRNPPPGSEMGK